jgi:hypothetical protein
MRNRSNSDRTNRKGVPAKGPARPDTRALWIRIERLRKRESVLNEEVCQLRAALHIYKEVVTTLRARNSLTEVTFGHTESSPQARK